MKFTAYNKIRIGEFQFECIVIHLTRVVGHARGRDLTGLKNDKKVDFVNFTLMATENY